MEVDEDGYEVPSSSSKGDKKRFEVKKVSGQQKSRVIVNQCTDGNTSSFPLRRKQWNAVALWAWGK